MWTALQLLLWGKGVSDAWTPKQSLSIPVDPPLQLPCLCEGCTYSGTYSCRLAYIPAHHAYYLEQLNKATPETMLSRAWLVAPDHITTLLLSLVIVWFHPYCFYLKKDR